jgi:type I site-specific restriction endonuclease
MSQFAFLSAEFPEMFAHASQAEKLALTDPQAACFYARLALEVAVGWLYKRDSGLRDPYETTLSARIHEGTFRTLVGSALVAKARVIKDLGNAAVHETRAVAPDKAVIALRELFHFAYWLTRTYARGSKPSPGLTFAPGTLPRTTLVAVATLKQLQEAEQRYAETVRAHEEAERQRLASETVRAELEAEIARLRAEVAAAKKANAAIADTHDYDEAATRDAFIDLLLKEAGWNLDQAGKDTEFPATGMPNRTGQGFVDYLLWGDDGKPLGLVEAKRTRRDARVGQRQAELYADCLEKQFGQRPVIFYTNGYEHWVWDDTLYPPRSIQGFLTKDELQLAIQRRTLRRLLAREDIDPAIVERFYQTRPIRRVYRKYGAIFDYFDSLLVGLTATPKDEVDRDTYRLFDLQRGVPTDAYGLDEAVRDVYLVPPRAVSVPLRFVREGIRYDDLSDEEKEQWDAIEWDETGTVPTQVDPPAVNKWLFNADTVDKVLEHLMTHGLKVAGGDRLGKTIIFAKNREHAQFIVERFDINYPHLKGSFARAIDYKTEYAQSLLDDFYQAEKAPHIAVSIDMLDTGIDVPEIVNLVFFKIVRSKTKFWQMLGRGTRLCPHLFGPWRHKEFFYVFDFCQNFEFFNQHPQITDGAVGDSLAKRLFVRRVELMGEIDKQGGENEELETVRSDTAARLHEEVAAMSLENFIVRSKRLFVEHYADKAAWEKLSDADRTDLINEVAGLPSGFADEDFDAKQFDLLLLRTQLALLRTDHAFEGLRKKIVMIASLLEELQNIPMVSAELSLILELQTDEYWQDITVPMLETVRRRLRGLIKLIEYKKRAFVYSDFEDEIGAGDEIAVSGVPVGTDMDRFRAKARQFLMVNENHIAILKLHRNEPLTATDLGELERIFGDTVIVTWRLADDPDRNARALRCFFAAEDRMAGLTSAYARKFGVAPRFRAGVHAGPVVVSECGDTKRQIAYFGDTMNVAARLCDHCKIAREALLVSADLLRAAAVPPGFNVGTGASIALRGRQAPIAAHAVRRHPAVAC